MKRLMTALVLVVSMAAPAFAETPPDQTARDVTDKILGLIKANREVYNKDHRKLFAMVDDVLLPHFDFRKVAQQVLGPTWRSATAEQRDKFTKEFRELMVRTYGTALLKYNDQEIVYLPLKVSPSDRIAVVRSQIKSSSGAPPVSINYSFMKQDAGWKVYDMAIEGPSIVTTYQRVYAERLQKEGVDALIASLAKENEQALAGKSGAAK